MQARLQPVPTVVAQPLLSLEHSIANHAGTTGLHHGIQHTTYNHACEPAGCLLLSTANVHLMAITSTPLLLWHLLWHLFLLVGGQG